MFKDIYGTELVVGDEVAFVTSGYSVHLCKGIFNGMTATGGYRITETIKRGGTRKTTLQNNLVIKINPPKPAWQWLGTHETSSSRK